MQIAERNEEIKQLYTGGMSQAALAKKYRVSQATISGIINYDTAGYEHKFKRPVRADNAKGEVQFDVKRNRTFALLRKKHPYVKGDKVRTFSDSGKYIKATVIQRTEWLIVLACEDGITRSISFQELAADEDLIKGIVKR